MRRLLLLSITPLFVSLYSFSADLQQTGKDCIGSYLSQLKVDSISIELSLSMPTRQLIVNITPLKQDAEYLFIPKSYLFSPHPDNYIAPLDKTQSLQLLSGIDSLYISKKKKICERIVKGTYKVDIDPPPPELRITIYRTKRKTIKDIINLGDMHLDTDLDVTYKVFSKTFLNIANLLLSLAKQGGLRETKKPYDPLKRIDDHLVHPSQASKSQ